jgi:hypothetical protein
MALTLPATDPAAELRGEVERAGGEVTMSVQAVLELFSDGRIDSNARRRARQGLAEHQLACEPDLVQAGSAGFVTIYSVNPLHARITPADTTQTMHEPFRPVQPQSPPTGARPAATDANSEMSPSGSKGLTTARVLTVIALAIAVLGATFFAAWTLGKSTRQSDAAVTKKVEQAVARRGERAKLDQGSAVAATKVSQRARAKKHLTKVVAKAKKNSYDKGYSAGSSAGYSAGNSAGYSAGNAAGVEEGVEKASDELTCSDDSDVALPACFDW